MIITHPRTGEKVDVASINVFAKCSDSFDMKFIDRTGQRVGQYEGYVPHGFNISLPGGGGDYINLKIDVDTGQILNWNQIKAEALEELI